MTNTRKWSVLAAVLMVAIFAAGWFLLVSPKRGEAAGLRTQTASQEAENSRLEDQLRVLQSQQKDLPKQEALLAAMKVQLPDNPALPSLIRDLTAAGRKVGVSVDSMAPSQPVALVASAPTALSPAASTGSGTTGSTSTTTTTTNAGSAAPASNLYQIPLNLQVTGSYFELEQFLNKLEGLKRSLLVSGFTLIPATTESSSHGDLTITINGRVFLVQDAAATPTTPVASPASPAAE